MSEHPIRARWRSLEESTLPEPPALWKRSEHGAPVRLPGDDETPGAPLEDDSPAGWSRRNFLKLMSASVALGGLSACARQPLEKIFPYARAPEEIVPGKPLFFATAMPQPGGAIGLLVESHMGRPTKVEGNPDHPASLGATDPFAQAAVLGLYDPDRSQTVTRGGSISTWGAFLTAAHDAMESQTAKAGAGLRILTESVVSPTLAAEIRSLLAAYPQARWHQYEPDNGDAARAGARLAFGTALSARYRLEDADVILALDSDFLASGPAWVRHARAFAARRKVAGGHVAMNRLYAVESTPTNTGAVADHRLALRAGEIEGFARDLQAALGAPIAGAAPGGRAPEAWLRALARDLEAHRGRSAVVPGRYATPAVHAMAQAINVLLGNAGRTVVYADPVEPEPQEEAASLRALAADLEAGRVDLLVVLGGNPAYTAPADVGFPAAMEKAALAIHLSLAKDETSARCHWHVNEAHFLEAWGDARAFDGTVSIVQPLIAPLYGGRSALELLAALGGSPDRTGHEIVRDRWRAWSGAADFEAYWRRALHDGVIAGTALPERTVALRDDWMARVAAATAPAPDPGLEIVFRPDPHVHDGRYANNAWLQELPKPLTKLTWDNAALVGPKTAAQLGVANEDVVELAQGGRKVRAPVWIVPGHPEGSVTAHLGYGRPRAGRAGSGHGFDAGALRSSASPWFAAGLSVTRTGERRPLACTQTHHGMEGRRLARSGTLEEFEKNPHFAHEGAEEPPRDLTLYPEIPYPGYAWGMAIDLGSCVGCNGCTIACQAENNIPSVGKEQVARGREMHWIRVDRYYSGPAEDPAVHFEPVPCMQCENAPCEVVCPVEATVHNDEGLNDMVYNRCVGTRYCSNNCPYKVRRFNFFQFTEQRVDVLKLLMNPDVTVRNRGVMEKCTYCVQRINGARIQAKKEERKIHDGEILTACQAACPADAIVFGDINDPNSRVSKLRASPLNYGLLAELNTRPRTTYLAAVRNPNPEIGAAG